MVGPNDGIAGAGSVGDGEATMGVSEVGTMVVSIVLAAWRAPQLFESNVVQFFVALRNMPLQKTSTTTPTLSTP